MAVASIQHLSKQTLRLLDGGPAAGQGADLPHRRSTDRPRRPSLEFIACERNKLATRAAQAICGEDGYQLSPLVLHGPTGTGKSHLLSVIAARMRGGGLRRIEHTTAGGFARALRASIVSRRPERFRAKYRKVDALLVDDIHDLAGKPHSQLECVHTFEALSLSGSRIVVTSTVNPSFIEGLHPGLKGRLLAGLCVKLDQPSAEARRQIVAQHVPELAPALIDYLVARGPVGLAQLLPIAHGVARENKPSLNQIRSLLVSHESAEVLPQDTLLEIIAEQMGVAVEQLQSSRRSRQVVFARQLAMFAAQELLGLTAKASGALVGRSASTAKAAEHKIATLESSNPRIRGVVQLCRVRLGC